MYVLLHCIILLIKCRYSFDQNGDHIKITMLGVGAADFDAAKVLVYSYCMPAKSLFTEHLARNTTCYTTCDYIGRVRTPNRPDTGRTLTCHLHTSNNFFLKLFSYFFSVDIIFLFILLHTIL